MSCTTCNSKSGSPKGCKNNGVCGTDGCNKLNVFNWLSNLNPISTDSPNYYEVRFIRDNITHYYRISFEYLY